MRNKKNQNYNNNIGQVLNVFSAMSLEELYDCFKVNNDGLSAEQIEKRLEEHGPNIIDTGNQNSLFHRIYESLINPFNIVLLAVVIVSYITDVVLAETPSYATIIMLIVIVLISSVTSFVRSKGKRYIIFLILYKSNLL